VAIETEGSRTADLHQLAKRQAHTSHPCTSIFVCIIQAH
jgi:hypothetical protein